MSQNNQSRSDERLAEIIFNDFYREYLQSEIKKYELERHARVMDNLTRGMRHHLKESFSYTDFNDMWKNCYDCTHHKKGEEFYNMFKEEVTSHVKENILSEIKCVEDTDILKQLSSSWTTFKSTMSAFSDVFKHLENWIENVPEGETPKDGIEQIGLNAFKHEIVLEEEIVKKLTSVLMERTEEHRTLTLSTTGSDVDMNAIKVFCNLLVEMNCYEAVFEENFLKKSVSHFEKVAGDNLKTMSAHEYCKQVVILFNRCHYTISFQLFSKN